MMTKNSLFYRALFYILIGLVCKAVYAQGVTPAPTSPSRGRERWTFNEDFRHGLDGWTSYPLAQDVGFDPSISTPHQNGTAVLVRSVMAAGQRVLHVGVLRTIQFYATPASSIQCSYDLAMGGQVSRFRFVLAGSDGSSHSFALPRTTGTHTVRITGNSLGVPRAGVKVEAIVIEADVDHPALGSINRMTIHAFSVDAIRPQELKLQQPALVRSTVDDIAIAMQPVTDNEPLRLVAVSASVVEVSLYDGDGMFVRSAKISPLPGTHQAEAIIKPDRGHRPGLWRAELESGFERTVFRFIVPGKVPPHPRILLTAEQLSRLRTLQPSNGLLQAMHAKAMELRRAIQYNPLAGQNIALLPETSPFPGVPQYFLLLENYGNAIAYNALDFRLDGDPSALDAARGALLAVSSWRTWTPPWWIADGMHTYYEVGLFAERVALGYDLLADKLTVLEKSRIAAALWKNDIDPTVKEYFLYDRMPTASSNHMANSLGGAIAAVVALYGDLPAWNSRLGTALVELLAAYERLLKGLFPGDGSEAEPAGYEEFAMTGLSWGLSAFHALGIRPHGARLMEQGFWWPRYAEVRPDMVLDSGDFDGRLRSLSGFAWEAEHEDNPALRTFYDTAVNGVLGASRVTHTGRKLEEAPGPLDLVCCTRPALPAATPPPSRLFPLRGSAVLRSGWKPTDTVISIRVGPWFNHEHHDQGTFQVAAFGEKLVSEAGYADYYKEPRYQDYFIQAPGHNTVLVDDDPFSQPGENGRYWRALANYPRFTARLFSPDLDFLSSDLAPAYDGALASFSRNFLFLKPDILIVRDVLLAPRPHRYTWLLHIPAGDGHRVEGADAFIIGKNAALDLMAAGLNHHWQTVPAPIPINDYRDLDQIHLQRPFTFRMNSARTRGTTFLVGMRFKKTDQNAAPFKEFANNTGRGFVIGRDGKGWKALFRTGAQRLECDRFSTDGDVLAVARQRSRTQTIFAAGFRSLARSGTVLLSATAKINATLNPGADGLTLHLFTSGNTVVKIEVGRKPRRLTIDGTPASPRFRHGYLEFEQLSKGEHVINIRT